jgi:hypothetical protein
LDNDNGLKKDVFASLVVFEVKKFGNEKAAQQQLDRYLLALNAEPGASFRAAVKAQEGDPWVEYVMPDPIEPEHKYLVVQFQSNGYVAWWTRSGREGRAGVEVKDAYQVREAGSAARVGSGSISNSITEAPNEGSRLPFDVPRIPVLPPWTRVPVLGRCQAVEATGGSPWSRRWKDSRGVRKPRAWRGRSLSSSAMAVR